MSDYDDSYSGCEATYATLVALSDDVTAIEMTAEFGLEPTEATVRGDSFGRDGRGTRKFHGWFFSSEAHIESRDLRRHLDWLLDGLEPVRDSLLTLRRRGVRMRVSCFYSSSQGHGGPTLSPKQMARLAALDLDCWLDVYVF